MEHVNFLIKMTELYDIKELIEVIKKNPHTDLMESIQSKVTEAANKGANEFFIFNSTSTKDELKFG